MSLRKGLSFLLVLLLVVSASASAFAAIPTFHAPAELQQGEILTFPGESDLILGVFGTDPEPFGWLIQHSETKEWVGFSDLSTDNSPIIWDFYDGFDGDISWIEPNHETKLTLFGFDAAGAPVALTDFYYTYITKGFGGLYFDKFSFSPSFIQKHFSKNNVTSFGPHFNQMPDPLTKKWFMFTPLTLEEGTQEFPLIVGNQYIIGKVVVTVAGDEIATSYKYRKADTYDHGEWFTFFPDYESITSVDPEEIGDSLVYQKPYSIANDLGGDTEVILYVRNVATFTFDSRDAKWKGNDRFWENQKEYKELRNSMIDAIGYGWIIE